MKRVCTGILFLLMFSANGAQDKQTVLLAAHRAGKVEVFDPVTLAPIGSINVLPLADGITSSPNGKFLYIPEGVAPDFNGCCALYALELETGKMTRLVMPTTRATVSPDGRYVVTQRGNVGIDVFDGRTLAQESPVQRSVAPGLYGLSFSSDARLLFGVTNSPQPSLDIFDVGSRQLVRRYSVSDGVSLLGTWVRDDFYLYSYHGADGQIWKVNVGSPTLGLPLTVRFPDAVPTCGMPDEKILGAGNRIFLYEAFGSKADRRLTCKTSIPGGVHSIDPETGNVLPALAADAHFNSLIASPDGKELYGIDVRNPNWDSIALLRLNAATGELLAKKELTPDVWIIDLASLPPKLVPHGEITIVRDSDSKSN